MNVLYFIAYPQRMAGANRSLLDLLISLKDDCRIVVAVTGEGSVASAYRAAGLDVRVLPPPGSLNLYGKKLVSAGPLARLRSAVELFGYTRGLMRLLRDEKIDLVHVNNMRAGFLGGVAARLLGIPVVGHVRGELAAGKFFAGMYKRLCHRMISVSEQVRLTLGDPRGRKTVTVYNGIGEAVLKLRQRSFPWLEQQRAQGKVVFAYFASVVPFKGHKLLLDAVARLNDAGLRERYLVLCLGDFVPESARYQDLLLQHQIATGADNVIFTGWQENPFDFYAAADVGMLLSANAGTVEFGGETFKLAGNEGFPRTVLEAMLFGKPVIGTDNAGVCEQITDGDNGRLIPPLQPEMLAAAMQHLIEDAPARGRMGRSAAKIVREKFSSATCREGVLRVYAELGCRP